MPKMKTNKTFSKKFKKNAKGKFKRAKMNKSHNTAKKSPKRRRQLRGTTMLDKTSEKTLSKMLPYA